MGEFELLEAIRSRLPAAGPRVRLGSGDDAAISVPGGATATSVDALIEDVHFRRGSGSLEQVGRKALAVALSDLAAMGAEPGEAYVVLGIPRDLDEQGCMELVDGMTALATETGTTLAGGDVTRAAALTLAMTVVGHAEAAEAFVTRSGARPGDALMVTGELGAAAAGLLILEAPPAAPSRFGPLSGPNLDGAQSQSLVARQLEPSPRLEAGRALAELGATAMIDLSDGLGGDAGHIAAASGVGLRIDASALPIQAGVAEVAAAAGRDPLELAAAGGEDYELLATLPVERIDAAIGALEAKGVRLTRIGEALAGEGVEIKLPGGGNLRPSGFDQLRWRAPP
ncbi:MAG TPA: thiamine-phosphate kinase [Solirubrobacterales bacterium]|nr:thiamine-phosphate kinase [Solirubrobacterales bacterium]